MTKHELINRLQIENVPTELYSLDGGTPHDKLCIEQTASGWDVYYSERGNKFDVEHFQDEQSACDRFYEKVKINMKYL